MTVKVAKTNKYLFKDIEELGISSIDSIHKALMESKFQGADYKVLTEVDLSLDDENRLYEEKVEFVDSIITAEKLVLRNSKQVIFTNCIIMGDLRITDSMYLDDVIRVQFDSCLFLGVISIHGIEKLWLSVYKLNATKLELSNVNIINDSYIFNSNIFSFRIDERVTALNSINIRNNTFNLVELLSERARLDFGANDLDINKLGRLQSDAVFRECSLKSFDLFYVSDISNVELNFRHILTLKELAKSWEIQSDKDKLNSIARLISVYRQTNWVAQKFVLIFDGFHNPSRVLLAGFIIYLLFAALYLLPVCTFDIGDKLYPEVSIGYGTSLYFSGVSFTTIGYGDIAPVSLAARVFAILEGVCGILTISSFVVTLVKKYIDV